MVEIAPCDMLSHACHVRLNSGLIKKYSVSPEQGEVAAPHSLSQLIVSLQGLSQARLSEVLVLRDLTQQQAHQDEPLADCHSEAQSAVGCLQGREKGSAACDHQQQMRDSVLAVNRKEKFTLFGHHNRSVLRQEPGFSGCT